jgi:hypothetical protein
MKNGPLIKPSFNERKYTLLLNNGKLYHNFFKGMVRTPHSEGV